MLHSDQAARIARSPTESSCRVARPSVTLCTTHRRARGRPSAAKKHALTWRASTGDSLLVQYPSMLISLLGLAGCGRVTTMAIDDASADGPSTDSSVLRAATCSDLPQTCGPEGTSSCCESKPVPGGAFLRGFDRSGDGFFGERTHPATISAFHLDTYEVTVGRFRQFVDAGYGTQAKPPVAGAGARKLNGKNDQGGWDPAWNSKLVGDAATLRDALHCNGAYSTWTDQPGTHETLPIVCITWFEAMAFCAWDGGYLPSVAESMFAMLGGPEQRTYPWSKPASSTTVSCSLANYGDQTRPAKKCNAAGATNVGAKSPAGDGAFGQADLGGNAMEWALDWAGLLSTGPCDDCADLAPESSPAGDRRLRGGSYQDDVGYMRGAGSFNGLPPTSREADIGVRCARPAEPNQLNRR